MRKHEDCPDQLRLPFDSSGLGELAEISPVSNVVSLNWNRPVLAGLTGVASVKPDLTNRPSVSDDVEDEIIQRVLLRAKRLSW